MGCRAQGCQYYSPEQCDVCCHRHPSYGKRRILPTRYPCGRGGKRGMSLLPHYPVAATGGDAALCDGGSSNHVRHSSRVSVTAAVSAAWSVGRRDAFENLRTGACRYKTCLSLSHVSSIHASASGLLMRCA